MKKYLRRFKAAVEIAGDSLYDARRFFRWSQSGRETLNPAQLRGRMLAKAHSIEKGLSMPDVRPFFGGAALKELCHLMTQYQAANLDLRDPVYLKGRYALAAYLAFHAGRPLPDELAFILPFSADEPEALNGGVRVVSADDLRRRAKGDFREVVLSRHSIRTFSPQPVEPDLIDQAVRLAQQSPSVCNRQACGVVLVQDPEKHKAALEIQGGNRGFGHEVTSLLVVTADLSVFRDSKERNQAFVDGGLFAMTLMYALHHAGVGCCPLNWSADRHKDVRLRRLLGIADDTVIIMLLGVGVLKPQFSVAASPRRMMSDVVRVV